MSKNIVIQEGGVGRQFTADKLTTSLVEGGTCNWVPEDEVQLGTKNINKNGTYTASEDNVYGYSSVSVNVDGGERVVVGTTNDDIPVIAEINIIDGELNQIILGDYYIVTYGENGEIVRIADNNDNECTLIYEDDILTGFDDAGNNHYSIDVDENGNIQKVLDPNEQECQLIDRDDDGKIDIITTGSVLRVETDDETGDIMIFDVNDNDVTDEYVGTTITGVDVDNTPWQADIIDSSITGGVISNVVPKIPSNKPGASITGLDNDGDDAIATIDKDGKIVQKKIPSTIEIIFPPTKTEYVDGENIDYSGIIAKLKLKSGEVFTDENYPNGIVPISELLFTIEKADIDEVSDPKYTDGNGIVAQRLDFNNPIEIINRDKFVACQIIGTLIKDGIPYPSAYAMPNWTPRIVYATKYNNELYMYVDEGSTTGYGTAWAYLDNGIWRSWGFTSAAIRGTFGTLWWVGPENELITAESTVNPAGKRLDTKIEIGGTQTIPVAWANPYNRNNALTTTFEISVTQVEESGGDNTGGSTTEGGTTGGGTE